MDIVSDKLTTKQNTKDITTVEINSKPNVIDKIINSLISDDCSAHIDLKKFTSKIESQGIEKTDPRVKTILTELEQELPLEINTESNKDSNNTDKKNNKITINSFKKVINKNLSFIEKCLKHQLIIPDFKLFSDELKEIYNISKENTDGKVADYIPQLSKVNPEFFGVSICTVDGQRLNIGDTEELFCAQSSCKPINYLLALEENGEQKVHSHIGREPSGTVFNEISLNKNRLPHNPMLNSGAIMACSLIKPDLCLAEKFDYILNKWRLLSHNERISFNNSVYLSEKQTADRNFALAYFMRENQAFPNNVNLMEVLDFYFQCCSIEVDCRAMSVIAATLANAGVCPFSNKEIVNSSSVQNCLSLMSSCGMYDFSGEFAFQVGIPAKSGVSGVIMAIIPNLMGICIWSPRLDEIGNSARGVDFCRRLVQIFNFHNYDGINKYQSKIDPRLKQSHYKWNNVVELCWAALYGDINEIERLIASGVNLNSYDYDKRTALHIAASSGQIEVVKYLLNKKINKNCRDRWNNTPLDDAIREKHDKIAELLQQSNNN